jgi:hypothetical protein
LQAIAVNSQSLREVVSVCGRWLSFAVRADSIEYSTLRIRIVAAERPPKGVGFPLDACEALSSVVYGIATVSHARKSTGKGVGDLSPVR